MIQQWTHIFKWIDLDMATYEYIFVLTYQIDADLIVCFNLFISVLSHLIIINRSLLYLRSSSTF